jgi:2,3-dihydroxyphenylpropionate 1,2-dioxygenase
MAEIVSGLAMSHVALVPDAPHSDQVESLREGWAECTKEVGAAGPIDAVVAFVDDHFENFSRNMMPAIGLSTADENVGPPHAYLDWLQVDRRSVPGHPDLAEHVLAGLIEDGFDVTRLGPVELGHNYMEPLRHLEVLEGVPVVPIFINVFTRPTPSPVRIFELGRSVRDRLEATDIAERVLVIGTGGLSHDPYYWHEGLGDIDDPFFHRMYRFQHVGLDYLKEDPELFSDLGRREDELGRSGNAPINEEWDRRLLQAFRDGDKDYVMALRTEAMIDAGGLGANEALNWIAVMGAMGGRPARYTKYEPVQEWITGFGFAIF